MPKPILYLLLALAVWLGSAAHATPLQKLYALTDSGMMFTVDTSLGSFRAVAAPSVTYAPYEGLSYYSGSFYAVNTGGDLVKFNPVTRVTTYIGNTSYTTKDIAVRSDGTAFVLISTNSDGKAESVATVSLTTAAVSNIVACVEPTTNKRCDNMQGMGFDTSNVLHVASLTTPSGAAWYFHLNTSTGVFSPQFTPGYNPWSLGLPHATHAVAVNPTTGLIYAARDDFAQAIYELFNPATDTGTTNTYRFIVDYPNFTEVTHQDLIRGMTYAPDDDNMVPILGQLLLQ